MTIKTIQINATPARVWEIASDVVAWEKWNGAIVEVVANKGQFRFKLRGIGWVDAIVHLDRATQSMSYVISGFSSKEEGRIELATWGDRVTSLTYCVTHEGLIPKILRLDRVVDWRFGRLKELCETGRIVDAMGPGSIAPR